MNRTRQPGPDAARRVLLWLLVSAAAVLAAQSQQWTSALTTATALYALADQDRRSRP
ncbi:MULTISPECIES: hypothetical protein [Streptomyces]|uniref:Uncharacterized protein n=1 Tax=Streptomyces yatensis TaxID=155177 RepID=A0ABN2JNK5_9ACTN|nr:hypothetical protein [Streptomyces sp. PSAA01]MCG0284112.1 hypothetical protein [Streptomyces sp. PSAA01]